MSADLKKALDDAAQAMKDSDAAMKKGDWSAYGDAQKQLQEATEQGHRTRTVIPVRFPS